MLKIKNEILISEIIMNILKIRNLELGTGMPAICVSNTGKTKEEILSLTRKYLELPMDIMEWRADWYENIDDINKAKDILIDIRNILGDRPLLFTFRTTKEGGIHEIPVSKYISLNKSVAETGLADLIDVETFTGDEIVTDMITYIHAFECKVLASNHDFIRTPSKDDILSRLCKMQDMGADILKIAVMPQCQNDVLTLLSATEEMAHKQNCCPLVTISMSGLGSASRISGEIFGSCLTFGSGETASAPGQIPAAALKEMIKTIHDSIK